MTMIISAATCGNCAFSRVVKEDFTLRECHGSPPSCAIAGMGPQGPAVMVLWPRLKSTEPACALHKRALAVDAPQPSMAGIGARQPVTP